MKIAYFTFLSVVYLSFCSCTEQNEISSGETVEVVFKTNKMVNNGEQNNKEMSVLTFKSDKSGIFSLLSTNQDDTNWVSDENGSMTKKIILSTGTYRFLMASGFSINPENKDSIVFLKEGEKTGDYDFDYYFKHPSVSDNNRLLLTPCSPSLYIDSNEPGLEGNEENYTLIEGNKFSVSRRVTRLQGRLDFMVRRGEIINNKLVPISEGQNNEDALNNAFNKIESIQVVANNISTRCHVSGLKCSTPGKYIFNLSKEHFTSFNSSEFVKELNDVKQTDYSDFDNSAYYRGPLLFPAPKEEDIYLNIIIDYKEPLANKTIGPLSVQLNRNRVTLVILWLLNEEIGIDVTVDEDDLVFGNGTTNGDNGFWN